MTEYASPAPIVEITGVRELGHDLVVVPNRNVDLVPNIGVIGGTHFVLVVETGLGPRNADKVLAFAAKYANGRRLYLTTTHFHPEHAFGAHVFVGEATFLVNRAQAEDLARKGEGYLAMFRQLGAPIARELEGVELPAPDRVYDGPSAVGWCGCGPPAGATPRATRWSRCPTPACCSPATLPRPGSSPSSPGSRHTTPTSPASGGYR
jgi:hypothetical protein